ncbi:MAG: metal-dependent transcriptional regulator [Candidatus Thermoplasmatota archaeon]|nr:metal-dependent transcriptional regulator [Candidatus Thermoplasmatota archaeon]MEC7253433.1 metal-dependent transcriptional regulator [Candidatus Thermoplasmatota archaeon]
MAGHFQEFEDEYLETMYEFYEMDEASRVRTGDLAERLGVSPASATEMIQRLSAKGYIDYQRYKGAKLTQKGLEHGQMMKRRHRLAEVLLNRIPFDGNIHETACRLEHAIDDDLEVALTVLLGDPQYDPSGRNIPRSGLHLEKRIQTVQQSHARLSELKSNESGCIKGLLLSDELRSLLGESIVLGAFITSNGDGVYALGGKEVLMDDAIANDIIVERQSNEN